MESNTEYCKVTAIIRRDALEKVEQHLRELGVPGISVTHVTGYGEYVNFYTRDGMTSHARIEIFCFTRQAEGIVKAIMDAAHSGLEGDGIVAVLPVCHLYHIRNRSEVQLDEPDLGSRSV
jgi:nitrogen regulatory protein P-II 1